MKVIGRNTQAGWQPHRSGLARNQHHYPAAQRVDFQFALQEGERCVLGCGHLSGGRSGQTIAAKQTVGSQIGCVVYDE